MSYGPTNAPLSSENLTSPDIPQLFLNKIQMNTEDEILKDQEYEANKAGSAEHTPHNFTTPLLQ